MCLVICVGVVLIYLSSYVFVLHVVLASATSLVCLFIYFVVYVLTSLVQIAIVFCMSLVI